MTDQKPITGIKDKHYDLISVLYHLLQGAETCNTYIRDAEREGDVKVVQYFHDVQAQHRLLAQRGKALLLDRLTREK